MIERTPILDAFTHVVLIGGLLIAFVPLWLVFVASTLTLQEVNQPHLTILPGAHLFDNLAEAWTRAGLGWKMLNSVFTSVMVAGGKVLISAVTAFAIVFFRFPGRMFAFWAIFVTLMLPLEVRIVPTYAVAANVLAPVQGLAELTGFDGLWQRVTGTQLALEWNLLNSYSGLILPLIATATGTFLYRQFFMTIPGEIIEAARMDGAGPIRTFREIVLPLSRANMVALFTIMFLYAWNQYLWPTLITTEPGQLRHGRDRAQGPRADLRRFDGGREPGLERGHGGRTLGDGAAAAARRPHAALLHPRPGRHRKVRS